jgi:hypothetical protein
MRKIFFPDSVDDFGLHQEREARNLVVSKEGVLDLEDVAIALREVQRYLVENPISSTTTGEDNSGLAGRVAVLEAAVAALQSDVASLDSRVDALEGATTPHVEKYLAEDVVAGIGYTFNFGTTYVSSDDYMAIVQGYDYSGDPIAVAVTKYSGSVFVDPLEDCEKVFIYCVPIV